MPSVQRGQLNDKYQIALLLDSRPLRLDNPTCESLYLLLYSIPITLQPNYVRWLSAYRWIHHRIFVRTKSNHDTNTGNRYTSHKSLSCLGFHLDGLLTWEISLFLSYIRFCSMLQFSSRENLIGCFLCVRYSNFCHTFNWYGLHISIYVSKLKFEWQHKEKKSSQQIEHRTINQK